MNELSGLWVFEVLSRGGVDVPAVMRDVPEAAREVLHDQEEAHPDQVNRVLDAASRNSGDADFGLRMNEQMTLEMLGPLGFVLLNAPTVGDFLKLVSRFYPTLYRGAELRLEPVRGGVRVRYRSRVRQSFCSRQLDEWTLGFLFAHIRQVAGPDWTPPRAAMQYARPDDVEAARERFGTRVRFGSQDPGGGSWFECPEEVLELCFDKADEGVLDLASAVAEQRLSVALRSESFATRARAGLLELMGSGRPGAVELSREMSVSLSTLKRRLAAENTSYRALHDECLHELADQLLVRTQLPVGLIARRLGYSDPSAFNHAFRRVAGATPSEHRARWQVEA